MMCPFAAPVKGSYRQREFLWRFLTAAGADLRGVLRVNLVEVQAVSFGNHACTPFKEGPPSSVADALTEVLVLYHVRYA